jgi:glycosyltransferase involved in cell wall biosynthesis
LNPDPRRVRPESGSPVVVRMNILIASDTVIPARHYGGTERVIWSLGKELRALGHHVTFLVKEGSSCSFGKVVVLNAEQSLSAQIPNGVDVAHFHFDPQQVIETPYVVTQHGNHNDPDLKFDKNTIFVSGNHAGRHGSRSYVYNGLDWSEYPKPDLGNERRFFHFLGKALWRLKNVRGAIRVARKAGQRLKVLGGNRWNPGRPRFTLVTPYLSVSFEGMVDNFRKSHFMNQSKGLIFPVLWHEPFGLAITESLYFGCPVFGTPYGSLPELVTEDVGFLSASSGELAKAVQQADRFSRERCHEYARDRFDSKVMAREYLKRYERVMNGEFLNGEHPRLVEVQEERFLRFE